MQGSYPGGGKKSKKPKYARSPRANYGGITLSAKEFGQVRGDFNTRYPNAKPEDGTKPLYKGNYRYQVTADGSGSVIINEKKRLK